MTGQVKQRISSIDVVRGIIIIIMTLDHVRDFLHIHAADENPLSVNPPNTLIFFTRWITHYCAPTFVFLAGISAWLAGRKRTKNELSLFLIKRGVWLILVDVVLISFGFSLNPLYNMLILEVLWAIGASMIILGLLVRTSMVVITTAGLIIFLGHNLLDYTQLPANGWGVSVRVLISGAATVIPLGGGYNLLVLYAPVTWAGILLLGYSIGRLYDDARFTMQKRQKALYLLGSTVVLLFIILRWINKYGDPTPWAEQKDAFATFLSFINTSKYPPSLLFSCMTLGPLLILLAVAERIKGKFASFTMVYGRAPLFYFVVHLYLIRIINLAAFFATGHTWAEKADPAMLFLFRPQHFGFNIWVIYLLWLLVVLLMYYPCKWFNGYRATRNYWWLRYT
ncbi:MAG TPA: heparan-alpha-glucosaminide N-acetyltransferase domain-containing protein [Chitinophagaceae bacterium]|nr:heparan-alpha-glucosaminide N-acetyltransferase domain-containing protein [Chitinophagaceae bacterium]